MHKTRFLKTVFAVFLMLMLLCSTAFSATAAGATLQISVSDRVVFAGDTVRVTLSLTGDLPDVGALELHLFYDTVLLETQSLTAGSANDSLRVIEPSEERKYTGVLFAYDYGTDAGADRSFHVGTLLVADFHVRSASAAEQQLTFSVRCTAAQDTAFRPLTIRMPDAVTVPVYAHPPVIGIMNYTQSRTVDYRTTLTLSADVTEPVGNGEIYWVVDGTDAAKGERITLSQMRQDANVHAEYRVNGLTLAVSQTQTIRVRTSFFARLAAFFRALFGVLPRIIQSL